MNRSQWGIILWLRWRLLRNRWHRMGDVDTFAGGVIALVLSCAVLMACVGGYWLGSSTLVSSSPMSMMISWDVVMCIFVFFWIIGIFGELQRSESIDFAKLMHLPVRLRDFFLFNFIASWMTPAIVIGLPGMMFFILGLVRSVGPRMLGMVPVVVAFLWLLTASTYLLRGWLVSMMMNERRRRTIVVMATIFLFVFTQLPNLYFQIYRPVSTPQVGSLIPDWFLTLHDYFPPLWPARSAQALFSGGLLPAMMTSFGCLALGVLALGISYRATLRFYTGLSGTMSAPEKPTGGEKPSRLMQFSIRGLPEEISAVAAATLRSMMRAPEVKMTLFGQVIMILITGSMYFRRSGTDIAAFMRPFTGTLVVILALFAAVQLFFNQFGFDRDGFRAYVLSPVSRSNLLHGKNLAAFPVIVALVPLILLVGLACDMIRPMGFLSSLVTLLAGYLVFSTLGNWLSIVAPYRMAPGSLKPTKVPPRVTLMIVVGMLLSPVTAGFLLIPAIIDFAWGMMKLSPWLPVGLLAALLQLLLAAGLYLALNPVLGRLLQRREKDVLLAVTREFE